MSVYDYVLYVYRYCGFHLGCDWMSRVERENIAHMLATMHMVLRQQDGNEQSTGQYQHLTNLTYEKFVERYKMFQQHITPYYKYIFYFSVSYENMMLFSGS